MAGYAKRSVAVSSTFLVCCMWEEKVDYFAFRCGFILVVTPRLLLCGKETIAMNEHLIMRVVLLFSHIRL